MKQRSLLDYIRSSKEEKVKKYTCEYCGKAFSTKRGLLIHRAKSHGLYSDEDVKVEELDKNHVQITIKIRRALFDDLMLRVRRAGTDLPQFLLEAIAFGDYLFDENVKAYISQRAKEELLESAEAEAKQPYIQ